MTISEEFAYLVWKYSQEEVIPQVEGVLAEAHHPPVINKGMDYSSVYLLGANT